MRCAILAGGNASRYDGKPKGLEKVAGERIIDRVLRALRAATAQEPILVANADDADTWVGGLEIVPDTLKDCGSLGGLHTAIGYDDTPVLVVAWDMPFVSVELLELLIARSDGHDVTVAANDSRDGVEPMCAVYSPACLKPIERQIEDEDFRASAFHDEVKRAIISEEDLAKIDDPEFLFFNVNSPEDLKEAEDRWRSRHE